MVGFDGDGDQRIFQHIQIASRKRTLFQLCIRRRPDDGFDSLKFDQRLHINTIYVRRADAGHKLIFDRLQCFPQA